MVMVWMRILVRIIIGVKAPFHDVPSFSLHMARSHDVVARLDSVPPPSLRPGASQNRLAGQANPM